MHINGPTAVHPAQSIRGPHHAPQAPAVDSRTQFDTVDELDISHEADFASQVKDIPDIRADRVAQIKAQIADGTYLTDDKLDLALERLLDEIG
ncbi:flagellar biosynthesis protein FlgM [Blastopirellula marina]|uniref:Flagellar biosynthesis protein FlgM n=1 Tax=Blastopirellula marina TaxID=124 RepID=A0A2S8FAD5_9BACT|nr:MULTISPECIES: flagellar biosynthesis anti-sigma factor FlgM [Pirellulaceae]PQO29115.1 flagellar biosynthesis protein FlgM [Blastopirellula marina]RCS50306.1 flagellar biosynthesis anti-sigma factor FlgM [Bremerella cremea]